MRKRFMWDTNAGKLVELAEGPRDPGPRIHFITDRAYENLTPVITKLDREGVQTVDISSRSKHRQYMKDNGLALADDFKETWAKAEKERAALATGQHDKEAVHETVARAYYDVFESPGIQQRPERAPADNDPALNGEAYPVVREFLPHGK